MGNKRYDADYDLNGRQRQNDLDQQDNDRQNDASSQGNDSGQSANAGGNGNNGQGSNNQPNVPMNNSPRNRDKNDRNDNDDEHRNHDKDNQYKNHDKDDKSSHNNNDDQERNKDASKSSSPQGLGKTGMAGGVGDPMSKGVKNLVGDKMKKAPDLKDDLQNPREGLKNLAKKHGLPTSMPTPSNIKDNLSQKVKDGVKNTVKDGLKTLDFETRPSTATAKSFKDTLEEDREKIQQQIRTAKKAAKAMHKAFSFAILHYVLAGFMLLIVAAVASSAITTVTNNLTTSDSDCSSQQTTDSASTDTTSGDESANMNTIYKLIMEGVPNAKPAGIAGLLGNGMTESMLNPSAIQDGRSYNEATAKNGSVNAYAFGIWQMDGTRRVQLINYAAKANKKWNDIGVQVAYIFDPAGDGSDSSILYDQITSGTDPATSAESIRAKWERGSPGTTGIRQTHAKEAYAKMADKHYTFKSNLKSLSTGKAIKFGSSGSGSGGSGSDTGSGSNISNGDDAANDNSDNSACSGSSDDGESGAATKLLGKALALGKAAAKSHKYVYSMYGARNGSDGSFDCSGFVTTMLKNAGYSKIPLGSTVSMLAATEGSSPEVGGKNLGSKALYREVDLKTAKKGTIVIFGGKNGAGGNGHVIFLAEDYHGNSTKILECTDWGTGEGDYSNKNNGPKTIGGQTAHYGPEYGGTYGNACSPGSPVAVLPLDSAK